MLIRIFQGVSITFTWTVGFTLAVETVKDQRSEATTGISSLGINLALLLGPLFSGVIILHLGYYSTFAFAFGVVFLDVLWRLASVEKSVILSKS